MFPSSG
jgi:hypothetical protein